MTIQMLNEKSITPELVLGILGEDMPKIEGLVAVVFNKDGTQTLHCCCSRSELALAVILVQEHCLESLKQRV